MKTFSVCIKFSLVTPPPCNVRDMNSKKCNAANIYMTTYEQTKYGKTGKDYSCKN